MGELILTNRGAKTRFFQVRKLPLILQPNSFYFVEDRENDAYGGWLTNKLGEKRPIGNVTLIQQIAGTIALNDVTDYRSDFEVSNNYLYSGFLLNIIPVIKRYKDGVEEIAQGVTDLESDWTNRLTLTYI